MSTPIQPVPAVILASEFPSLADRIAGLWNQKAKDWADSENAMAIRTREIAVVTHSNALAAKEAADAAVPAADTAVVARDKALEYQTGAQAAAAAAGSGAGLPSLVGNAGKALVVGDGEDAVGWEFSTPTLGIRNVTSAATIGAADQAIMVRGAGAFTLSFASLANLPEGWFCYVKNAGGDDITLDPGGSEQIDGRTSYIMYPGECRLIAHNGTEFVSVVLNSFYKVFAASGNFIKPPGYEAFGYDAIGGGGSGSNSASTGPGAGGGNAFGILLASSFSSTESVTVGSGGASVAAGVASGSDGGDTTFGSVITAFGGRGGGVSTQFTGTRRTARWSLSNYSQAIMNAAFDQEGGKVIDGTPVPTTRGGGSGFSANPSTNCLSSFHGNGGISLGADGSIPGGGGAKNNNTGLSGAGARGELRIWGII